MLSEYVIELAGVGKCYHIYDKPSDRLKQILAGQHRRYYHDFWALRGVDLRIRRGQTLGIIGKNGSGKSTLLQLICGTLNPTEGTVKVRGLVAALLELGAGFNPEFTGVENVYMAASLYGLAREEVASRFDAIAAFADIGAHIHQPVKNYSSGMYVRLAFAVIANVDADVLVIDEALAVGDAFFVQKCIRFLRDFKSRGTLLLVSHDMQSVLGLCSDAILLESGHVLCFGTPKEISERYLAELHKDAETEFRASSAALPAPTQPASAVGTPDVSENVNDFGTGMARVVSVMMTDRAGKELLVIQGGEAVQLQITCHCDVALHRPLIGFVVRDRLAQVVFGENTGSLGSGIETMGPGRMLRVCFEFQMPGLRGGKYSISAAIGEGTQEQHVHHHWKHDALIFDCMSPPRCFGLMSVEMSAVRFME